MTIASKAKGDRSERECEALLRDLLGNAGIRRALGAGRADDVGDIHGIDRAVVQVANWADALRAVREKPVAAEAQRLNAGVPFAVSAIRLRGGVWRFVMSPEQFCALYREATA